MSLINYKSKIRHIFSWFLIAYIISKISQVYSLILNTNDHFPSNLSYRFRPLAYICCTSQLPKLFGREELLPERDVYRGTLKNGLNYTFFKNDKTKVEVCLQVCSGSADENDHQKGMAHLCEHVSYMGSQKRRWLSSYPVKTNAFTDFNHTVFFARIDDNRVYDNKEHMLMKMLDALVDVLEAPTQFNQYELDKERKAVFAESNDITNANYRRNTQSMIVLQSDNILPQRLPIGNLEAMKNYTVEDLKKFHDQHYIPDNTHLYIKGNFEYERIVEIIESFFSKLENPKNLNEIRSYYKNTEKDRHMQLYNDVYVNSYDCINEGCVVESTNINCEPDNWKNSVFYVISEIGNRLSQKVSKSFLDHTKESVLLDFESMNENIDGNMDFINNQVSNRANLTKEDQIKITKKCYEQIEPSSINDRLNKIFSWYKKDLKGIHVCASGPTGDISTDDVKSVFYEAIDAKIKYRDMNINFPDELLDKTYVESIVSRSSNNILPPLNKSFHLINFDYKTYMNELPDNNRAGFSDYYKRFKEYLRIVNDVGTYKPTKRNAAHEYEDILTKQYGFEDLDKKDTDYMYSLLKSNKPMMRTKPCILYQDRIQNNKYNGDDMLNEYKNNNEENKEYKEKLETENNEYNDQNKHENQYYNSSNNKENNVYLTEKYKDGYELFRLNNNLRLNYKREEGHEIFITANIPIVDYIYDTTSEVSWAPKDITKEERINRNKLMLLLITTSLMESGSMGNLDRKQVEIFCELNSIIVNISKDHDYLRIDIDSSFNSDGNNVERRDKLMEYSLQIMNNLLENHKINVDEFERAKKKLIEDKEKYTKDIKEYAIGDITYSLSGGRLGYHKFDFKLMEEIKYEELVEEANKLFDNTRKEVNIVSSMSMTKLLPLILKYLSSSSIISKSRNDENKYNGDDMLNEYKNNNEETKEKLETENKENNDQNKHENMINDNIMNYQQLTNDMFTKNKVEFFQDVSDRAVVIVGGYAPNKSGFLPDGRHMSALMENEFKNNFENMDDLCILRRELWMHPAFPIASADLFSEALYSDLFSKLRTMKNLTYDTKLTVFNNDINQSYFIINTFSNIRNYSVVLSELLDYLKRLSKSEREFGKAFLDSCKRSVKIRIKNRGVKQYTSMMSGIQLPEATTKNILSLTEYEHVLDSITPEDFSIMLSSKCYGINSSDLYTRVLYSNVM